MGCLCPPALSCFQLEVIRFCWEEKNAIHRSYFISTSSSFLQLTIAIGFCSFAFPTPYCLWIVTEGNLSQMNIPDFEKVWIWIQRFIMGWNNGQCKSRQYRTAQAEVPCGGIPLDLQGWEQNVVGTNRVISFSESRSHRHLPRLAGSPTIMFFRTS